tara:strand:- start:1101 stop:1760 length:660 start_codon:yes stop_codon:yes gene_type:complete
MPSNKQQTLSAPAVPTMPDPGSVYSDKNVRASNNLLRTFMLRLTGALQALFGPNGGQYIDCPNGLFFNTATQTFAVINTGYPVVFNATYLSNAVQLQAGSTSRIEALVSGVYNFQYTGQVLSSSSNAKEIAIWIRRDGTDINYSTRVFTDSDNDHRNTTSWSFNIDLQAGQYVEIIAAVTSTALWLDAAAAASPRTAVPSSVMSVNFISPLPQEMPTPP